MPHAVAFAKNHGRPLHYLGNRFLSLPDASGHMVPDNTWLNELFSFIQFNTKGKKYKRCIEPFAGSASWSLAAMEIGFADEYVINDSDAILIGTLQCIQNNPLLIKEEYSSLLKQYEATLSKKAFFLETIKRYNESNEQKKSLLLPFIINHSWSGILFHDADHQIIYSDDPQFDEKHAARYLEQANLSSAQFIEEIDNTSKLLNQHQVTFTHGDFSNVLIDIQPGDFVALNPPYPENERSAINQTGMYIELHSPETLHQHIVQVIERMETQGVHYYMTYGFYNPELSQFVLRDNKNLPKNYFHVLGYQDCAFGIGLDQMYFHSSFSIPEHLQSKFIPAATVLNKEMLTPEEALRRFYNA